MKDQVQKRQIHEIEHGRKLAAMGPETTWGWGSPAGQVRAARRGRLIIDGAGLALGRRVLEVGCGTGLFTEMFARTGAAIVAVEISESLLDRARARGLPSERVSFVAGRFEDSGVAGPFDAVIGSSVLHHLDLTQALRRMLELLRPGGRLSFAEPNMLNPQVYLERRFRTWPMFRYVSPDETAFARHSLRARLHAAGFDEVRITPFDWLHPAIPSPFVGLVSRLGGVLERTPGIREFAGSLHITARRPS